jgi:hypothetical protein
MDLKESRNYLVVCPRCHNENGHLSNVLQNGDMININNYIEDGDLHRRIKYRKTYDCKKCKTKFEYELEVEVIH